MSKSQLPHPQRIISPKRVLAALIAVVVFFLLLTSVINLFQKYRALRKARAELYRQQALLLEKHKNLESVNEYLRTDEGREYVLREKYNVVRPGEEMIIITNTADVAPLPEPRSRIGRWWDAIVHGLGFGKEE